jgi:hypothetical protein
MLLVCVQIHSFSLYLNPRCHSEAFHTLPCFKRAAHSLINPVGFGISCWSSVASYYGHCLLIVFELKSLLAFCILVVAGRARQVRHNGGEGQTPQETGLVPLN